MLQFPSRKFSAVGQHFDVRLKIEVPIFPLAWFRKSLLVPLLDIMVMFEVSCIRESSLRVLAAAKERGDTFIKLLGDYNVNRLFNSGALYFERP